MPRHEDQVLAELKVPNAMRPTVAAVLSVSDEICATYLDREYAYLCRVLASRLARKRPSPLARGDTRIWAAGVIYAIGQINFLFDPAEQPHLSVDELANYLGVVKTTMANKAAMIRKALSLGMFEPDLTREDILEEHPMAWIVQVNGLLIDVRTLSPGLQDKARQLGLIPDLQARRAA